MAISDAPELSVIDTARTLAHGRLCHQIPQRWAYTAGVARRVTELLTLPAAGAISISDGDDVIAAAWLHDVGYSPPLMATGMHAIDGARWVKTVPEVAHLAPLVEHHSNARFEAAARGLTLASPPPEVLLHSILWVADFTTSHLGLPLPWPNRLAGIRDRYPTGPVRDAIEACLVDYARAVAAVFR